MPVYEIFIDGKPRKIELAKTGENRFKVTIDDKTLVTELSVDEVGFGNEFTIKIEDKTYRIELSNTDQKKLFPMRVEEATFRAEVKTPTRKPTLTLFEPSGAIPTRRAVASRQVVEGAVTAPMTGKILSVLVEKGNQVKKGQVLCILEAMKMENEIVAPKAGTVREVIVSEGSSVSEGEVLFVVD